MRFTAAQPLRQGWSSVLQQTGIAACLGANTHEHLWSHQTVPLRQQLAPASESVDCIQQLFNAVRYDG